MPNDRSTTMSSWSSRAEGSLLVVLEMSLSVAAIVLNLLVLISVRNKERLMTSTPHVLMANVCLANLVCAVFVKSIGVVYNGYAVATRISDIRLAFCSIYTIVFRVTWAVLPYTLVTLVWHALASRVFDTLAALDERPKRMEAVRSKQSSFDTRDGNNNNDDNDDLDMDDDYSHGLSGQQKFLLALIWLASLAYASLWDVFGVRDQQRPCSLLELDQKLNMVSILFVIIVPSLLLVLLGPLAHLALSLAALCFGSRLRKSLRRRMQSCNEHEHDNNEVFMATSRSSVQLFPFCASSLIWTQLGLTLVFLGVYPIHMVLSELLLSQDNWLAFVITKYCVGCLHLVLAPVVMMAASADIRRAVVDVASHRSN